MGDTPSRVVARRACPSGVASFGRVAHAPADPRALYSDTGQHYIRLERVANASKSASSSSSSWCSRGETIESSGGRSVLATWAIPGWWCRCSETSPVMGSTPYGVAARRTCPSSVTSFGRVTHAPADLRALYRAIP